MASGAFAGMLILALGSVEYAAAAGESKPMGSGGSDPVRSFAVSSGGPSDVPRPFATGSRAGLLLDGGSAVVEGWSVHRTGRRPGSRGPERSRHAPRSGHSPEPEFVMGLTLFGGGADREYVASEFTGGALLLGAEVDGRARGQLELGFRSYDDESLRHPPALLDQDEWYMGGNARFFFGPPSQGIRPYSMLGFTLGAVTWDYAEPVLVDVYDHHGYWVGTDEVEQDRLWTGSVFAGGGLTLIRAETLELGINGRLGLQVYDDETRAGLRNDLFDTDTYAMLGVEVSLFSGR